MKLFDIILDNNKTRNIVFKAKTNQRFKYWRHKYVGVYRNWYGTYCPLDYKSFGKINEPAKGIKLGKVTRFNFRQVANKLGSKIINLRQNRYFDKRYLQGKRRIFKLYY